MKKIKIMDLDFEIKREKDISFFQKVSDFENEIMDELIKIKLYDKDEYMPWIISYLYILAIPPVEFYTKDLSNELSFRLVKLNFWLVFHGRYLNNTLDKHGKDNQFFNSAYLSHFTFLKIFEELNNLKDYIGYNINFSEIFDLYKEKYNFHSDFKTNKEVKYKDNLIDEYWKKDSYYLLLSLLYKNLKLSKAEEYTQTLKAYTNIILISDDIEDLFLDYKDRFNTFGLLLFENNSFEEKIKFNHNYINQYFKKVNKIMKLETNKVLKYTSENRCYYTDFIIKNSDCINRHLGDV